MKRKISIRISDEVDDILKATKINASEFFRNKILEEFKGISVIELKREELKKLEESAELKKKQEIEEQKFIYRI